MKKLLDYIFLMRPMLIVPVWTIALLGTRAASWRERGLTPFKLDHYPFATFQSLDANLLLMLLFGTLLAGAIFILNQIYDIESDRQNEKLFLLADGHVSVSEARVLYWVLTVIAIAGAFWLNWQLGILFIVGAGLGFQYSFPPLKVRENAYKAFRNNIVGHGMVAFLFGWVIYTNFSLEGVLKSLPYVFAVGAVYLTTTLPDIKGDVDTGKKTYAAEWGITRTIKNAAWMVVVALILSVMAGDYGFTITAGITAPVLIAAALRNSVDLALIASKIAILVLSLFAAMYFPIYFVILIVTYAATRLYYAKRFGLAYPAFSGHNK